MPTEAEWEYACRAGTMTKWHFGNSADRLKEYGWYNANARGNLQPVGQQKPNPLGLYDMYGNVAEHMWGSTGWTYYSFYLGLPHSAHVGIGNHRAVRKGPIIAAAVTQVGLILACLAPLALCVYLLWSLKSTTAEDEAMTELLVEELSSDRPRLAETTLHIARRKYP